MMKHICFINPHYIGGTIGGAEVQLYILAKAALESGWRVTYVTHPEEIPLKSNGIEFQPFRDTGNSKNDRQSMERILREVDADVYYQRGRKMWTGYAGHFSKTSGKPFIFAASMDIDCKELKVSGRHKRGGLVGRIKSLLVDSKNREVDRTTLEGMRRATLVLAQTNTQARLLNDNLGITATVFPNIHPVPEIGRIKKASPPTVLWLASVKKWKRPEIFLRLVNQLKDLDCRFVLAGRLADKNFRSALDRAERENSKFSYVENVSFERSNELLADASVFVNTSRMEEGFPNTYVQAWLRGTPTVALGFDPDNVIETKGLGANVSSVEELCDYVATLINDSNARKEAGNRARSHGVEYHGMERNAARFFRLVEDVVERKRQEPGEVPNRVNP